MTTATKYRTRFSDSSRIAIRRDLLRTIKIEAARRDTTIQVLTEEALREYLKNTYPIGDVLDRPAQPYVGDKKTNRKI